MMQRLEKAVRLWRAKQLAKEAPASVEECLSLLERHHITVARQLIDAANANNRTIFAVESEWILHTTQLAACLRVGISARLRKGDGLETLNARTSGR